LNWRRAKRRKIFMRPVVGRRGALQLLGRCLLNELVKYADEGGRIWFRGDDPIAGIGSIMGVSRGDRRLMAACLEEMCGPIGIASVESRCVAVNDFSLYLPRRPGEPRSMYEAFLWLYCEESGSFARLSVFARGLAGELLRLCNDVGEIENCRDLAALVRASVGGAAGLSRHHWPYVQRWIAELQADGYVVATENGYRIPNFEKAQPTSREMLAEDAEEPAAAPQLDGEVSANRERTVGEPSADRRPTDGEVSANRERSVGEPSANRRPSVGDTQANSAELFASPITVGSDPIRTDQMQRPGCEPQCVEVTPPVQQQQPALTLLEPTGPPCPALLTFPCVGGRRRKDQSWDLTTQGLAELEALYPGFDVMAICREACAFTRNNTGNRKTADGMPEFLRRWVKREVNGGKAPKRPTRAAPAAEQRGEVRSAAVERAELDVRKRFVWGWLNDPDNADEPFRCADAERPLWDAGIRALLSKREAGGLPPPQTRWYGDWLAANPRDPRLVPAPAKPPAKAPAKGEKFDAGAFIEQLADAKTLPLTDDELGQTRTKARRPARFALRG
jgi:hypothetical protein